MPAPVRPTPERPVVVVGAGISGVACARELREAGLPVRVVDRGRRVGGRMAVRTLDGHAVDTGAAYFTVKDDDFAAVVADWQERGLAREWTDTVHVADASGLTGTKSGPVRWAAAEGLRSLVEDLATGLEVGRADVATVGADEAGPTVDGDPAAAVVLAMPDPQALRLLVPTHPDVAAEAHHTWSPVLVLVAQWPERSWPAFDTSFVNDHPVLTGVADDGRRRGDGAPVLVAHSTARVAAEHLDDPASVAPLMTAALRDLLGIADEPTTTLVHRWTFAQPVQSRDVDHLLAEVPGGYVGLCGDGWATTSKVEAAWLSGRATGRDLVARYVG